METANILQNGAGKKSAQPGGLCLGGDCPACSPPKVERLEEQELLLQNEPVLNQYQHLTAAASALPLLLLRSPVCPKHGAGDEADRGTKELSAWQLAEQPVQ